MVTVAFPPRLVAMETPREPLSFTFRCPLCVSFALPESTSLFPRTRCRDTFSFSHTRRTSPIPSHSRSVPSLRVFSPSRQLGKLLSTSGIRSYSLRSFEENEEDERAREIKRNERTIRERETREAAVLAVFAHARYRCLPRRAWTSLVSNRSISYRLKVIYVPLSGALLGGRVI